MAADYEIEPLVVSVQDACKVLSCCKNKIYALINAGELETVQFDDRRKVIYKSLKAFIARLHAAPGNSRPRSHDGKVRGSTKAAAALTTQQQPAE